MGESSEPPGGPAARIIPVIDLLDGRAVRGRSGDRRHYRPVRSRIAGDADRDLSDPQALLAAYRALLDPERVYVADLNRIAGGGDNDPALKTLIAAAPGVQFLWDGGFSDAADAARGWRDHRVVPVIGTETLRSIDELRSACHPVGAPAILSLDLDAAGVVSRSGLLSPLADHEILEQGRARGLRSAILLLLDRVGTGGGLPRARLERLRVAGGGLDLMVGGGIASIDDLLFLRQAGFSGALVATALHDGLISRADLRRATLVP